MNIVEFAGVPASPGLVIGRAALRRHAEPTVSELAVSEERVEEEVARFLSGRDRAGEQIEAIAGAALLSVGSEAAEVLEGHLELLRDSEIEAEAVALIRKERYNAARAAREIFERNARELEENENAYLRERAADLRDVASRLLRCILGCEAASFPELPDQAILLSRDLTPSETAQIDRRKVVGIVTETGGSTSHVAIMARSLGIPAVVGVAGITEEVRPGDTLVVDGGRGRVIVAPTEETLEVYRRKLGADRLTEEDLARLRRVPAATLDGHRVEICANIGSVRDLEDVLRGGTDGIGLFRTEFLFMDRERIPSEEEQLEAYRSVVSRMEGKPVILRTVDIGGDKELPYLRFPKEANPFLGWRAIRMCLDYPELLIPQLRACLRSSAFGKVRVLYPMIVSLEEVRSVKGMLAAAMEELRREGTAFDATLEQGIMVETPAAVLIADKLIDEVDFFSLGTNDLTQYLLAVDRGNQSIARLYQPLHPAVLRAIKSVVDVSHAAGKWTGVCGEMAGDGLTALLLVGLGVDELSMTANTLPRVKDMIRRSTRAHLAEVARRALELSSASEVLSLLEEELGGVGSKRGGGAA